MYVELPEVGTEVKQGEVFGVVESVKVGMPRLLRRISQSMTPLHCTEIQNSRDAVVVCAFNRQRHSVCGQVHWKCLFVAVCTLQMPLRSP